ALPTETPSTRNSTRTTARLSVAAATMTVDPGMLAPSDGEDTVTTGGVMSRTVTVTVSVPTLPSASRTVRVTTYAPGVAKTYDTLTPWSVCIVPSMNVHVQLVTPTLSVEADPSSVTVVSSSTTRSGPAFATGGTLSGVVWMRTAAGV